MGPLGVSYLLLSFSSQTIIHSSVGVLASQSAALQVMYSILSGAGFGSGESPHAAMVVVIRIVVMMSFRISFSLLSL